MAYELGKKFSKQFTSKNSSEDLLKLLHSIPARDIMTARIEVRNFENNHSKSLSHIYKEQE